MHVFIFFNIINYFLDKKIISDLFNTYNQVLTIFLAQSMTSKLRQRSTQTKGMVKINVNYYYFSVHFRWKYWKQELKNKTNPSAKFQYTITKSDISSKGFWNYGWNGASQCIVSFHDFIGEPLHSITMNVGEIRWDVHNLGNNVTQVSSRWNSFFPSLYKFLVMSPFFPMWHLI